MRAKKSLGQHFLKSEKALTQIVGAGDIGIDDVVLEIGPGTGVLTSKLLSLAGRVIAIEKDRELIPVLEEKFSKEIASGKLEIIEADVLKFDITNYLLLSTTYKLIANIPYYITGAIIEKFLSAENQPERVVLLIQKEVAERIVAKPHSMRQDLATKGGARGKESVLSIAVKVYGTPRIVAKVPAGAFVPAPKVDSAIILIENISQDFFKDVDEKSFFRLLKFVFGKKRKQIGGSLSEYIGSREKALVLLESVSIDSKTRPENLTISDWKKLARHVIQLSQ